MQYILDRVYMTIIGLTSESIDLSESQKIILYPIGMTPINDFEYESEDEINQIIEVAKTKTLDELYKWSKSLWQKVVVATPEQITLLTADSIFTFFQDRFTTTHYTMVVARVGSGKGAILITFTYLGYRTILGGNMSGASILDLLGSLEGGQVVIAEDELNYIKDDADKWKLYTTGYDAWGLTTRTLDGDTSNRTLKWFPGFGYKIFGAESSLDTTGLGGLLDRTFQTKLLKGKPKLYIKNLRRHRLPSEYEDFLSEINYFRKVMLVYRLLHADDLFEIAQINIDGRALELTGPTIDLFYALLKDKNLLKEEILPVLSYFLREKGEISKNSLDNIVFNVIKEYSDNSKEASFFIPNEELYTNVRIACSGQDIKNGTFDSPVVGEVSQRRISNHCRDKLKAKDSTIGTGNNKKRGLLFDKQVITYLESSYDVITEIKLLDDDFGTVEQKNSPTGYRTEISSKSEEIGFHEGKIEHGTDNINKNEKNPSYTSQSLFSVPAFQTNSKVSDLVDYYLTQRVFRGTYKGADVLLPKKGLYSNVVVVEGKEKDRKYNIK